MSWAWFDGTAGATGGPANAVIDSPTPVSATASVPVDGWATRDALIVPGGESKQGTWT